MDEFDERKARIIDECRRKIAETALWMLERERAEWLKDAVPERGYWCWP